MSQYSQYSTLGCYNNSQQLFNNNMGTSMNSVLSNNNSKVYMVPTFGGIGYTYSKLSGNASQTSGGYFKIMDAYGQDAEACPTTYSARLCNQGQCSK